jgi:hypothetical protein
MAVSKETAVIHLNDLPTVITTPGEYVTRNGGRATIKEVVESQPDVTAFAAKGSRWRLFRGKLVPRDYDIWHISGRRFPLRESGGDIVAPYVENP